ncbi:DNA polymerase Y family protein [Allopusillimonas soli]|uniref:DNA polymerase Y family protein n=1 Tax=Allopusillimonas soli TaxID=659016 RepID=A0A853FFN1_9BURK|nr:DNA polymerase Y family protein [Allopusillimonas soli]NYT36826.1 DNA polymerase Y family protein [Allopusillimonas soli]TEA75288.1 DNA polymerase Y family protein [Allopusillimonas soli]
MSLWISLYLPTHSLDACFPSRQPELTAAVLRRERVLTCTPAAASHGVMPGMSAGSARSLLPEIRLASENIAAEQRCLREIAMGMLQYSPHITCQYEHAVLLEVQASLSLFKGPRALCRRIGATLRNMGVHACLGMAPSALGAWILSRQTRGRRRLLQASMLAARLDRLPVGMLPEALPHTDWLNGIGCLSLAQLRALPRKGLQQRSAPALMQQADAAYGFADRCHTWFEAPLAFKQHHDLLEHLEHGTAILAVAARLIEQLCGWLHAHQCAVNSLSLTLAHEKGRHARPPTQLDLRLSDHAWQAADFLRVLRERLQHLTLPAPVIRVSLSASDTLSRPGASSSLFPEPGQWLHEEHRLLDLLCARLGEDRVRCCRPAADYSPEQANQWYPVYDDAAQGPSSSPGIQPPVLSDHARPFWLLDSPQALPTRNNQPVYQGRALRLTLGPERLESNWWLANPIKRDYFMARDDQGARYWIYRQREGMQAGRWFLHGLFA